MKLGRTTIHAGRAGGSYSTESRKHRSPKCARLPMRPRSPCISTGGAGLRGCQTATRVELAYPTREMGAFGTGLLSACSAGTTCTRNALSILKQEGNHWERRVQGAPYVVRCLPGRPRVEGGGGHIAVAPLWDGPTVVNHGDSRGGLALTMTCREVSPLGKQTTKNTGR